MKRALAAKRARVRVGDRVSLVYGSFELEMPAEELLSVTPAKPTRSRTGQARASEPMREDPGLRCSSCGEPVEPSRMLESPRGRRRVHRAA